MAGERKKSLGAVDRKTGVSSAFEEDLEKRRIVYQEGARQLGGDGNSLKALDGTITEQRKEFLEAEQRVSRKGRSVRAGKNVLTSEQAEGRIKRFDELNHDLGTGNVEVGAGNFPGVSAVKQAHKRHERALADMIANSEDHLCDQINKTPLEKVAARITEQVSFAAEMVEGMIVDLSRRYMNDEPNPITDIAFNGFESRPSGKSGTELRVR